jgi:hypothetical protein
MHPRMRSRLSILVLTLCVGMYACTEPETATGATVFAVELKSASSAAPVATDPPCEQPLPVGGKRMAVDPDFPADVLLIIQYGPDGNASQAVIDQIEKKYGIGLTPFLGGRDHLLGGSAPLSNAQLAQMRCEPGVLAIKHTYSDERFRMSH